MARITLDEIEVTSFFTDTPEVAPPRAAACSEEASTCEWTIPEDECLCTSDISTCPRTSFDFCDSDVYCATARHCG